MLKTVRDFLTAASLAVRPYDTSAPGTRMSSFEGISSDDVSHGMHPLMYVRKNLQQQGQHGQEGHSFH